MKYYIEISLLGNNEIPIYFLWQKLYQQIHLGLVEIQDAQGSVPVGVSFPQYNEVLNHLGCKLRLFSSTQEQLQQFNISKWLNRLTDYTHCTSIKEAPQVVNKFAHFKRVQFDTNIERLARRRVKRKSESLEQALKYFNGFKVKENKLPFVNMSSLSNNMQFRLFIKIEIVQKATVGKFNCYGLSKTATVPWFK